MWPMLISALLSMKDQANQKNDATMQGLKPYRSGVLDSGNNQTPIASSGQSGAAGNLISNAGGWMDALNKNKQQNKQQDWSSSSNDYWLNNRP